jgi:hypothetical protein
LAQAENKGCIRFVGETYEVESAEKNIDPKLFARMVADIQLAIGLGDQGMGPTKWVDKSGTLWIENFSGYPFVLQFDQRNRRLIILPSLLQAYQNAGVASEVHKTAFLAVNEGVRLLNVWLATLDQGTTDLSNGVHSLYGRIDVASARTQLLGTEIVLFDYLIDYGTIDSDKNKLPVVQIGLRAKGSTSFENTRKSVIIFTNGVWRLMAP